MELKKLELDVTAGKLLVNGVDYSDVSKFNLHYEHGVFELEVSDKFYATGKKIADSALNMQSQQADKINNIEVDGITLYQAVHKAMSDILRAKQ